MFHCVILAEIDNGTALLCVSNIYNVTWFLWLVSTHVMILC